jgi:hypothetical protein
MHLDSWQQGELLKKDFLHTAEDNLLAFAFTLSLSLSLSIILLASWEEGELLKEDVLETVEDALLASAALDSEDQTPLSQYSDRFS